MVRLIIESGGFGISTSSEVVAHYNTLEEAVAQAEHDLKTNTKKPLRIVDEDGEVVWEAD